MGLKIARFLNLMLASLLVGNEAGGLVGWRPALNSLPLPARIRAEQAATRRYGRLMPPLMTLTVVSAVPVLTRLPDHRSPAFRATLGGTLCFLAMLGVTFAGNMPLNRRTLAANPDAPPEDWAAMRAHWERWHALRNALNVTGLALLLAGVLSESGGGSVKWMVAGGYSPVLASRPSARA